MIPALRHVKQKEDEPHIQSTSWTEFSNIIGPAIGWLGVSVAWSLQKGYGTRILEQLGLNKTNVNYVWLAGPISGIIIQPIIGSFSDKINKRRPFIIFGCLTIIINLLIYSNTTSLYIAVIIFWLNDFCINILMVPLRALSSDKVSSSKQIDTMSWFSILNSLGSIIIFSFAIIITNVSILYFIGSIIVLLTSLITLKIDSNQTSENRNLPPSNTVGESDNIFVVLRNLPLFIWKIMHAQFWSFSAFFPFWIYIPTFYAENVMNGKIGDESYEIGQRYSNIGYWINSVVMIIASYLIPKLLRQSEIKIFWIISYLICAVFLCITPFIHNDEHLILFIGLHSLCGITSASMEIFPWQITSSYTADHDKNNKALILTIVNLSVCISQIIVAFIGGLIINYFDGNVASILCFAGICKLIAAVCVYFIDLEYREHRD